MIFKGQSVYLESNNIDFFYKHLNKAILLDKKNKKSNYRISYKFFGQTLNTNISEVFIDMFYDSIIYLKEKTKQLSAESIDISWSKILYDCPMSIIITINDDITYEKHISFNNTDYYIYERERTKDNHDSFFENSVGYDPIFKEKQEPLNCFDNNIVTEIKNILCIKIDNSIEYNFGGEQNNNYIEIPKTFDCYLFKKQLNCFFDKFKNGRDYFEGHILLIRNMFYQIDFYCDDHKLIATSDSKKEIQYCFAESYNFIDEYTDEDMVKEEKLIDEFTKSIYQLIDEGTQKVR